MRSTLLRFWSDRRGAAAVEFAIVTPVLVGLVLAGTAVFDSGTRLNNMRQALRPAAQYYMNGGVDDAQARTLAMDSWKNPPGNAAVTSARACRCGDGEHDCSTLCPDGTPTDVFVTLTATASWTDTTYSPSLSQSTVVRVR
jgi:Flp pilus assembly protein TadG